MSDADVHHCLQVVADRLVKEGHFLEAIKCHVATLIQSLLPADEATARLKLAQLLLEHTSNVADGKQHLQKAVSTQRAVYPPELYLDVFDVVMGRCSER